MENQPAGHVLLPLVLSHLTGGDASSMVVINIDETNMLMGRSKGEEYLKSVVSCVCNFNQRSKGFVLLILSGTNVVPLHQLVTMASGAPPVEIMLPLLEASHMREVLSDLAQRIGAAETISQEMDFVFEVLGGVPRYVELLAFELDRDGEYFCIDAFRRNLHECVDAAALLEKVVLGIVARYGREFAVMLSGIPRNVVVAYSLSGWHVSRATLFGDFSAGQLESRGIVFVVGQEPHATIRLPLILLLRAAPIVASSEARMLLKHFDVLLTADENELASLAACVLKCWALQSLNVPVTLERLFGASAVGRLSEEWKTKELSFDRCVMDTAARPLVGENWDKFLELLRRARLFCGKLQRGALCRCDHRSERRRICHFFARKANSEKQRGANAVAQRVESGARKV
jgi:hypothetical protein